MEAEVRATAPSGVDPLPAIRAMRIPAIWLFGGRPDRAVAALRRAARSRRARARPDFTYRVFPGGTHGLLFTANGLIDEQARSSRFVEGYFATVATGSRPGSFTG